MKEFSVLHFLCAPSCSAVALVNAEQSRVILNLLRKVFEDDSRSYLSLSISIQQMLVLYLLCMIISAKC